jgi:hypothetical protein
LSEPTEVTDLQGKVKNLPPVTAISYVHTPGKPQQTYRVRFRGRLDGIQESILRDIIEARTGHEGVHHWLSEVLRLTIVFLDGDRRQKGLRWLHQVFRPYVPFTATLEIRQEGKRLTGRLVLLNNATSDDMADIHKALSALDIVTQVEREEYTPTFTIHFRPGVTLADIKTALVREVPGVTPLKRLANVCLIDTRRPRRS